MKSYDRVIISSQRLRKISAAGRKNRFGLRRLCYDSGDGIIRREETGYVRTTYPGGRDIKRGQLERRMTHSGTSSRVEIPDSLQLEPGRGGHFPTLTSWDAGRIHPSHLRSPLLCSLNLQTPQEIARVTCPKNRPIPSIREFFVSDLWHLSWSRLCPPALGCNVFL